MSNNNLQCKTLHSLPASQSSLVALLLGRNGVVIAHLSLRKCNIHDCVCFAINEGAINQKHFGPGTNPDGSLHLDIFSIFTKTCCLLAGLHYV